MDQDIVTDPTDENIEEHHSTERDEESQQEHMSTVPERRYPLRNRIPKIIQSMNCSIEPTEPSSYKDAMDSEHRESWKKAIEEEYSSLMKNQTWILKPCPEGRTPISCKWIFTIKPGHHDTPPRYKARLVARGFSQRQGIDYQETFAPVVRHSTIRTVFSIVAERDLDIVQFDVKTAFLYGELQEELYMSQPEGYITEGKEEQVCALKKCLYGLKQASRVWSEKFCSFLLKFGLTRSKTDQCLFFCRQGEELTIILIYVDDGIIASNNTEKKHQILSYLASNFEIRILEANRFVGMNITRDRNELKLFVDQTDTINKALTQFNLGGCNIKTVPADPNSRLSAQMAPQNEEEVEEMKHVRYRQAVGILLYISIMTRPDIAFATNQVAQYCQNPGKSHWRAVVQIFAYLLKTSNFCICYDGKRKSKLIGFTDSDFAGDLNRRRSTTGYVFFLNNGPICWSSQLQKCTAQSTTEAELVAACGSSMEAIWLRRLINEIGLLPVGATPIKCDNQSTIQLIHNPVFHQKTKHIEVKYFLVRELQEKGDVDVSYVDTTNQLADIFTKPLPGPKFENLRSRIGVIPLPIKRSSP